MFPIVRFRSVFSLLFLGCLALNASAAQSFDLYFANAAILDDGQSVDIAINDKNNVVEIHEGASNFTSNLYYRAGTLNEGVVSWGSVTYFDKGDEPSVALNDSGVVVEIHETSAASNKMWYHVGALSGTSISWGSSHQHDTGTEPAIAMNNAGAVVQVHQTTAWNSKAIMYHVGTVDTGSKTINWKSSSGTKVPNISGAFPSISVNNNNTVLLSYSKSNSLYYIVGHLNPTAKTISWESQSHKYTDGVSSSIDLGDDNFVVEMHKAQTWDNLWTATGSYSTTSKTITFQPFWQFESGVVPAIAANDRWAVEIHPSDNYSKLWFSTGRIMSHSNWMGDRTFSLGNRRLKELVVPGSHDAGMYAGNKLGKTQQWDLYHQLSWGSRWFDLRVRDGSGTLWFYHNIVDGPKVAGGLGDIAKYMGEGHREVVFLKFSHFKGMSDTSYSNLVKMIESKLGKWLYKTPVSGRLADLTFSQVTSTGGKVIPVFDEDYIFNHRKPGFFVYRDCTSCDPQKGDLTVYDVYSDTTDLSKMEKDQLGKWSRFKGQCKDPGGCSGYPGSPPPCDMFLLSWTLTPMTGVWTWAKQANAVLVDKAKGIQSHSGLVPNILYTDYVDYANGTYASALLNSKYSAAKISMRRDRYYLTMNGDVLRMNLTRSTSTSFDIEHLRGNKIALKLTASGKYICLGASNMLYGVGAYPAASCRFEVVPQSGSSFALKASNGLFLRRYSGGRLAANDRSAGKWNRCYLHQ